MSTSTSGPKKVRLACRRCRIRRIKCDSLVPACTNCSKAGQVCLDVDGQNTDVIIPRNFASTARSRIKWLEDIIRQRLPDVDLLDGPQVDLGPSVDTEKRDASPQAATLAASDGSRDSAQKRPAATEPGALPDQDGLFAGRARTISTNLGMLSLGSDSHQKHYLGSSSGLFFSDLIGASPSDQDLDDGTLGFIDEPSWNAPDDLLESTDNHLRAMINLLRQELPPKRDALTLAHTYLRWVHPSFPFLEQLSLLDAIDAFYALENDGSNYQLLSNGWPSTLPSFRWNGKPTGPENAGEQDASLSSVALIVFMVLSVGALVQVRSKVYEFPPQKYYRTALKFSKDAFSRTSLSSIQALIMLVVHGMMTPSRVNLWTLVHLGLASCVDIGIHREPTQVAASDFALQQMRRYVFFTIYSLDRSISSIQGRPLGFRDETFDIQLPQAPHSEEGNSHGSGTESYFGSLHRYSIHHFKLDRLVSDIKLHLYHLPTDSTWLTWPQDATDDQQRINRALDSWWSEAQQGLFDLPGIEAQQQRVWKLKLKIRYHTVKILLFQPSQVIQNPSTLAVQICFDNASSILSEYQDLYDLRGLHMGWRSVQNIFSAGATLIYSFWMSSGVQKTVSTPAMCRHLRTCSNLLSIGGESWPSVRNGQRSFDSVVDLTVRKLYEGDTRPSKVSRLSANASHPTTRTGPHLNADGIGQQGTEGLGTERSIDHAHGEYGFGDEAMFRPDDGQPNQEMWTGAEMAVQDGASRFDPEVESFLAEFDQSEFTWSFPINENPPPVIHFGLPPM